MTARIRTLGAVAIVALIAGTAGYRVGAQEDGEKTVQTLEVNQVARVGERVISAEELIQRLVQREKYITDPDERTARWALDSLLVEELLQLEADRLDASPKPGEVRAEKEKIEESEREELKATNELIVKQQQALGKEPRPYSWEEWIERKYNMTTQQYNLHLLRIARQNLLRRLVIRYWADSTEHADAQGIYMRSRKDLAEIRARVMKGEKFELLARDHSEDMWTRQNQGEIGTVWPGDGSMDPEVEEAFWKLDSGEVSEIIQTYRGFWIVKRARNYPANKAEFYDRRDELFRKPNVDTNLMRKWRQAMAASGRYTFERRVPGWDCEADRP